MTPRENLEQWREIERRARLGAKAAAEAMARYVAERTAQDTLTRTSHAPDGYYEAPSGMPPAYASGALAQGMYWRRAQGGDMRASAFAGNRARHAKLHEFGCEPVSPTRMKVMHWVDSKGSWYHARLPADGEGMPEHPFLGPTTDEAIQDGELQRVATDAFREYDP